MNAARLCRGAAWGALILGVGFATAWAFLAHLHPDRVFDFASMLQMCGIPIAR